MPKIVSVDVETTGLIPGYHEVWEVALVPVDSGREHLYYQFQPTHLERAEAEALKIGGFYENFDWIADANYARDMLVEGVVKEEDEDTGAVTEKPSGHKALTGGGEACWRIAKELEGATLLGQNVHFDADHLEILLNKYGHAATWGHRYLDLGSYAAGAFGEKTVLSGRQVSDRMEDHGIVNESLHNAHADARWNVDAYHAILDGVGR